ncbi:MAG TPA: Bax inhibitor-1/YccA family protein [Spirochaetota bacterium]|nr:Bax inhibitor-1/YccA family protein [Spirochaetota bacterium]HPP49868.1 Bax inhibitor-1/YccA family protein [Spirochaetota bacterium]
MANSLVRSGNPVLRSDPFTKEIGEPATDVMTIEGAVNKTIILLLIVVGFATLSWYHIENLLFNNYLHMFLIVLSMLGFIVALLTIFMKKLSPWTAPVYSAIQGLFLGIVSMLFEKSFPGIVLQAVGLTFGILFSLLLAYKSGLIKATENFKLGVAAATGGIFVVYLCNFILRFFGIDIPFIHEGGILGILFSLFVVVIAALNLVIDFDFIEKGAEYGAPKYMEWYAAFGLMVTLIWLYLEILRLLAKTRRR